VSDCTICRILRGDLPSSLVFRDSHCAAFMDIHPINAGHVLVVPLSHAAQLSALEAATAGHIMIVAQGIAAALRAVPLRCEGVNLLLADGEAAGQEVLHVHMHVVPRYAGDGFGFRRAPESKNVAPHHHLESAAAQLRAALERAGTFAL
jgi:histidine triad (HIT) family protein